jgi:hypothetical protein
MPASDRGGADAGGWLVLLLGGTSGVGKTRMSYRLARHFGVPLVEVDDFQAVLERLTTPQVQPELHFYRTRHDEWRRLDEEGRLAHTLRYGAVMAGALEAVIANHLEGDTPLVLVGDFILPSLAVRAARRPAAPFADKACLIRRFPACIAGWFDLPPGSSQHSWKRYSTHGRAGAMARTTWPRHAVMTPAAGDPRRARAGVGRPGGDHARPPSALGRRERKSSAATQVGRRSIRAIRVPG